jgi:hypothetical protein
MLQKVKTQLWSPTLPKVVDLSKRELVIDRGIPKSAFEAFSSDREASSYCGYKWELVDNNVRIYDRVDLPVLPHERGSRAFDAVVRDASREGGWSIRNDGSGKLINLASDASNWQPDSSFYPSARQGQAGSVDKSAPYPTMVLEVASPESDSHVMIKAQSHLGISAVQIVVVLLIRPSLIGAHRLQVLKYERGQQNPQVPCWERSFADPLCTRAEDCSFMLPLPFCFLFDNAPVPAALVGKSNIELGDLQRFHLWKKEHSWD